MARRPAPLAQTAGERGHDLVQVEAQGLDLQPFGPVAQRPAQAVEGRLDELLDVAHDALLELLAVLLALVEQHAQGGVALVQDGRLAVQGPAGARQLRAGAPSAR